MARSYSRAKRTFAALMFSPGRLLKLSVMGKGLAVFAGQHLPTLRRRREAGPSPGDDSAGSSDRPPRIDPEPSAANDRSRSGDGTP